MDIFSDPVLLARLQFACTAAYHFIFVPLTIGLGLILAINETRYYRSRDPKDAAATKFWVKIFTATFVLGLATGITMEFSFGTNWADYSRFVGDIFGAPLAAEALLAFFLESTFLGVLLFGRKRVSPKFYMVSAWLVWFGSALSALWILIANSWMQTPAGAELSADGSKAVITDFLTAAMNPVGMAALLAHHRGRAHHGARSWPWPFPRGTSSRTATRIRHEDDEAGAVWASWSAASCWSRLIPPPSPSPRSSPRSLP
mgnify:CR=1 FL=1